MFYTRFLFLLLITFHFFSCKQNASLSPLVQDSEFSQGTVLGNSDNTQLNEISGMVASRQNKGMFWVHNDSGDANRIFLVDSLAKLCAMFYLKDITNRDWEDISITTINGENWLYIADIGDNEAVFDTKFIYRFKEPKIGDNELIAHVEKVSFQYIDGNRDAETLIIDHSSKYLYILSKREEKKRLYSLEFIPNTMQTTKFLGEVNFSSYSGSVAQVRQSQYIVGGDISPDNQEIIIKNYVQVFYWRRKLNETLLETLNRTPKNTPYIIEPQGEAISFGHNNQGYYTLSESSSQGDVSLYFYAKKRF